MSKTITDLREKLFDTIDRLNDKENPMEVERAHAIVKVADSIIDSAKVEVQAMKIAGVPGTGFVDSGVPKVGQDPPPAPLRGHERLSAVGKR